jgi:hypothetical protein
MILTLPRAMAIAVVGTLTLTSLLTLGITPTSAGTVVGGSDLLVGSNLTQVESWLVNDPQLAYSGSLQFTNVFDKSLTSTSLNFHNAVDGIGPTIVLMQATPQVGGSTQIIGGYNPQSWHSGNNYNLTPNLNDRTAFIFNLSTSQLAGQRTDDISGQYQTYNHGAHGPSFGGGHDIYVGPDLIGGYTNRYSYLLSLFGDGHTPINIGQLEVFTIAQVAATPVPAALPLFGTGLGFMGLMSWWRKKRADAVV